MAGPINDIIKMVKHEHWTRRMRCQSWSNVNICCADYRRVRLVLDDADDDDDYANLSHALSISSIAVSVETKLIGTMRGDWYPNHKKNSCHFRQFKKLRIGALRARPAQARQRWTHQYAFPLNFYGLSGRMVFGVANGAAHKRDADMSIALEKTP